MTDLGKPLLGRSDELAQLATFLATPTGPGAAVVRGDAGVGKTALIAHAAATAANDGWHVLATMAVEFEAQFALTGLSQLVLPFRDRLSDLDPHSAAALAPAIGRDAVSPAPPLVMALAWLELLSAAARDNPVLVVIDDAQWLDEVTAAIVTIAGQRILDPRVRLLAVCRAEVHSVIGDGPWPRITVGAFDTDTADAYLRRQFPDLSSELRALILQEAAGNPLALDELPRHPAISNASGPAITLTERLQGVFGGRLVQLDTQARGELLRAALDGSAVAPAGVTGGASRYRMRGAEGAIEYGLLRVDENGELVFRHPLVRAAVIQMSTANERRAAHAFLAGLYADDIVRRAAHLSAATIDPDDTVSAVLEDAANTSIRRGGSRTAVNLLRRAAELSKKPGRRAHLSGEAAFVAAQAARLDDAASLLSDYSGPAGTGGPAERAAAALTQSYLALYRNGDVISTHRRMIDALAAADDLDDATVTRLVNAQLAISQYCADPDKWALTDLAIDAVAERLDPKCLVYRDAWGDVAYRGATVTARLDDIQRHIDTLEPWDLMRLGVSAYYVDSLESFRVAMSDHTARESGDGAVTNAMTMEHLALLDQINCGRWAEAEHTAQRGLALTREHGHEMFEHQFLVFEGLLAASKGEIQRARELGTAVDAWARPRRLGLHLGYAKRIALLCALTEGDYEAAWTAATAISAAGDIPHYSHQALRAIFDLVEAAVRSDRLDAARQHVGAALRLNLAAISPRLDLTVAGAMALVADEDDADELFNTAIAHPAAAAFPFEHARIRLAYGMWLRRQRRYRRAQTELAAATEAFEALGAQPWAARTAAELRAAGSTPHRGYTTEVTLSGQERRIAEMAADGLSNKEIAEQLYLSPRTVGAHLYRVFPKLGITRRSGLRQALEALDTA
ncbi:LuxR family transcriptional regulator [Mycolicibacterium sp. HK-90]|uniref:LuxR family transcriptional regulator n=1 Tax=Mycolicibacterium sp. HK-90 TaxID=3056937 RepID=UPI0026586DEF|nr:LuxR family transcriptional regulator [Mycolicibacterium sp. HK-90]WKG03926.1 LuxR family transcriptional regulator [Mycolicibacterium sp. HK-90]